MMSVAPSTRAALQVSLAALSTAALLWPAVAHATCLITCEAEATFADCSTPADGDWPADTEPSFAVGCETCCGAPGSPPQCGREEVAPGNLSLLKDGVITAVGFDLLGSTCGGLDLVVADSPVAPGQYELTTNQGGFNLLLATLEVTAMAEGCVDESDCGPCGACEAGECGPMVGEAVCLSDADCPAGESCDTSGGAWCLHSCVAAGADGCLDDEACGPCEGCADGVCEALPPACVTDSDCPEGQWCVTDPAVPCQSSCSALAPCVTDDDCGPCSLCMEGFCYGQGPVICEADEDCAEGLICVVDGSSPCANRCEPPPPACVDAEGCPPCHDCDQGACLPLASLGCVGDEDCGEGAHCLYAEEALCQSTCVSETSTDDCTPDAGCGPCEACTEGMCVPTPEVIVCEVDGDCAGDLVCLTVAGSPCENRCVQGAPGVAEDDLPISLGCAAASAHAHVGLLLLGVLWLRGRRRLQVDQSPSR